MRSFYMKKEAAMVLFMLSVFLFSILNLRHMNEQFTQLEEEGLQRAEIEAMMNDRILGKYAFIEAYGYLQNILDKKEINAFEVIKGERSMLYLEEFSNCPRDVKEVVQRTLSMRDYLENKDIRLIALLMPDKYVRGKAELAEGYPYNYANETMDLYKEALQQNEIPVYDVRTYLEASDQTMEQLFYHTDHHWRIETAFHAYQQFLDWLTETKQLSLDESGYHRDEENFNFLTYPSLFLGSLGRKTGSSYAGSDDFTFVYPKFETDFQMTWTLQDSTFTKFGRFETTLANPSYLRHEAVFDEKSDTYSMYLDGNSAFTSIINRRCDNDWKVLFIKDSYALPFAAFFSLNVKQTDLLDPRYYEGDLQDFIQHAQYDYVITALSPSSLYPENLPLLPRGSY